MAADDDTSLFPPHLHTGSGADRELTVGPGDQRHGTPVNVAVVDAVGEFVQVDIAGLPPGSLGGHGDDPADPSLLGVGDEFTQVHITHTVATTGNYRFLVFQNNRRICNKL